MYSSYPVAQRNNLNSICKLDSFKQAFNQEDSMNNQEGNYLYNYIQHLIEYYGNGKNISELRSIYFKHAGYLRPELAEKRLFKKIGSHINKRSFSFLKNISLKIENKKYHSIIIEKDHLNYVKQLHKSYFSLFPCLHANLLKNSINLVKNFNRYVYCR